MSYFGNYEKDDLLDHMKEYLEDHPISELIEIVRAAIELMEEE